ncbi:MAG TPA: aspartate--tRNA(Asn) ligase [Candidatus Lachnoclostridium stercoripullorum]|uniref:Aspartate--tRNA(Asp/Asn) ligase n=1 Tax=Candidatus Lachnoclostridium stercoripullorum TaxID=2838635 RepID=A0A9D1W5P5_9FIRM|nr:aspartate--tRNA(Asn) ligase [Candidatus Lachnoclostridium stercoripullorum]
MKQIVGIQEKDTRTVDELAALEREGMEVKAEGAVHRVRNMGEIVFVVLRQAEGLLQTVFDREGFEQAGDIREGCTVRVEGVLRREERAPRGVEIAAESAEILSVPAGPLPLPVDKRKLGASLEARLDHRAISLRNVRERARFRVQEGIVRGFRDFLYSQGFTEIHTPKIGAKGAEGGANIFKLSYFHRPAVLAQSPQFYKQMMVGVFDRVFETGPVFRAEKHNTRRHLNEYTSLDFEMGYIRGMEDVMGMETEMLRYVMEILKREYARELELLDVTVPEIPFIPALRFDEAKCLVSETYGRRARAPFDLEPEEESLIGTYAKETFGSDFVFITHYPSKKRPFYAMDDPQDVRFTLSFDLLYKGMEITTGGQRIHDYRMLTDKMAARGMTDEGMEEYLEAFRCGMPPHGGLGIGLERLTVQLLGEDNVREGCLFPRDMGRLTP